jgi:hypothetical protein
MRSPISPHMFGFTSNDLSDMTEAISKFCDTRAEKAKNLHMPIVPRVNYR